MSEATTEEPVATGTVEATAPVATAGAGKTDDELKKFGAAIAVCALLLLFGGETFAVWHVNVETDFVYDELETQEVDMKFGTKEIYVEQPEVDGDGTDSDSWEYDDSDVDLDEVADFFSNLKILLYVLLIGGAALGYMGHTGEKMEFAPKVIVGAALVSVLILLYTFFSLPAAYDEDTDFFDDMREDPAFFSDNEVETGEGTLEEAEEHANTTFSIGFFVPLISLGAAGYLINDRGIKLEDITG